MYFFSVATFTTVLTGYGKFQIPEYFFFNDKRNHRLRPDTRSMSLVCLAFTASCVINEEIYCWSAGFHRFLVLYSLSVLIKRKSSLKNKITRTWNEMNNNNNLVNQQ